MNQLIAVVGMAGTGKSVITDYLEEQGWAKVYFGGLVYEKMREEGIEITPDSQKEFREKIREQYGMAAVAILLLPKIKKLYEEGKNVVLDGLYSWDEYKVLEKEFPDILKLVCVVTNKEIRYERVAVRPDRPFSKDDIIKRDLSEIENLAKGGPIAYADYFILNNGNMEEEIAQLKNILKQMNRKEEKYEISNK